MGIRTPDLLHAIRLHRRSGWVRKGASGHFTCDDVRPEGLGGSFRAQGMADRLADSAAQHSVPAATTRTVANADERAPTRRSALILWPS